MLNDKCPLLENIILEAKNIKEMDEAMVAGIAERLEEAISSSSRAPLQVLGVQLVSVFNKLLRMAPPSVVKAVRNSDIIESPEAISYLIGQIGFAQRLAAEAFERRADDEFSQIIFDHRYQKYITALYEDEHTGIELARISQECEETVSRKLKKLRELGITDFRREGTKLLNFLTPSAESLMNERVKTNFDGSSAPSRRPELDLLSLGIPQFLQTPMNFALSLEKEAA